jgi:hypothetical protein
MTARNEIRMAIALFAGIGLICGGLFSKTFDFRGIRPLTPYQVLLFRVFLVGLGINGIFMAYEIYNGH